MPNEFPQPEIEAQRARIQGLLQQGYNTVWSDRRFPNAHVPDIAVLRQHVAIGGTPPSFFEPHPLIKPELREMIDVGIQKQTDMDSVKKVAWYDPFSRQMQFNAPVLSMSDEQLRRTVYHESATDTVGRCEVFSPDMYTAEQAELSDEALHQLLVSGTDITSQDTNILKMGFRRVLRVGEYAIADLMPQKLLLADEVYPNAFEIITDQILQRVGDIRAFERDIENGAVHLPIYDANINFSRVLFAAMQVVNWRDILTAFKTGDVAEVIDHLRNTATNPDYAEGIFLRLVEAIEIDEQNVYNVNSILGYKGE